MAVNGKNAIRLAPLPEPPNLIRLKLAVENWNRVNGFIHYGKSGNPPFGGSVGTGVVETAAGT